MKIAIYSTHDSEKKVHAEGNANNFDLKFFKDPLTAHSVALSESYAGIVIFTSDDASAPVLHALKS